MKKTNLNIIILAIFTVIYIFSFKAKEVEAQISNNEIFNPNNIISDQEMMDVDSMSLADIQNFLVNKQSFLANYQTSNAYGDSKTAAQIIYDAAKNNYDCDGITLSATPTEAERKLKCRQITTVNPKFLLVLLQKEQSLIKNPSPTQKALDEATGYGCPTGQSCNPYWKGFGKQVNSAALQFLAYIKEPSKYSFKAGNTYIAKDSYSMLKNMTKAISDGDYNRIVTSPSFVSVTIENQATAALYNYTPHVLNGNLNFHSLYNDYFPQNSIQAIYPDGSLLKLEGEPGIWLIENGKKRAFLNYASFISRFSPNQVIVSTSAVINSYPRGENIKFPNFSLVQTPNKTIYLLANKEKRPFESLKAFQSVGFNIDEIENVTENELLSYTTGQTINSASTYVTGALLQNNKTGGIYYIENGTKAPIPDKIFLSTRYKDKKIISVSPETLNNYITIEPVKFADGTLLKSSSFPAVYLISNGVKRAFASEESFYNLGYNYNNILTVSSQLLYQYPVGEIIQ